MSTSWPGGASGGWEAGQREQASLALEALTEWCARAAMPLDPVDNFEIEGPRAGSAWAAIVDSHAQLANRVVEAF